MRKEGTASKKKVDTKYSSQNVRPFLANIFSPMDFHDLVAQNIKFPQPLSFSLTRHSYFQTHTVIFKLFCIFIYPSTYYILLLSPYLFTLLSLNLQVTYILTDNYSRYIFLALIIFDFCVNKYNHSLHEINFYRSPVLPDSPPSCPR